MVNGEIVGNLSDIISVLPPEVWSKVEGLILIANAVGIFAIVYFIYAVTMGTLSFRRTRKIEDIEKRVLSIDKKLDKLLKKKK